MLSSLIYSQKISGKVISDSVSINHVLVVNMNSQEKIYSDSKGQFDINVTLGDEIRFIKEGYERKNLTIQNQNKLIVNLIKLAIEIDEVKIDKKLTGNLSVDSKLFNENKKKVVLNNDLKVYFKAPSSAELMKPKPGEFVQPVPQGMTFGDIKDKWEVPDLVEWIRENLTDDYFISMGFELAEINAFIYYSLRSFNMKHILKYGYCSDEDVGNLKLHFERSYEKFRNK